MGYLDNLGQQFEFSEVAEPVWGMYSLDNYLLVRDSGGYRGSLSLVNQSGVVTHRREFSYFSQLATFNAVNSRLYHFRDGISPNDIHYVEVNLADGTFGSQQDSPHHGDYSIRYPIIVSADGSLVLTGAGDVYDAETLRWSGSIGRQFDYGYWSANDEVVTIDNSNGTFILTRSDPWWAHV